MPHLILVDRKGLSEHVLRILFELLEKLSEQIENVLQNQAQMKVL